MSTYRIGGEFVELNHKTVQEVQSVFAEPCLKMVRMLEEIDDTRSQALRKRLRNLEAKLARRERTLDNLEKALAAERKVNSELFDEDETMEQLREAHERIEELELELARLEERS